MKDTPGWDDYAYFAAVARTGGLMRAAQATGVSAATLSRRMKAFEARLGRRLFRHGGDGYALTGDGRALADKLLPMEAAAVEVQHWRNEGSGPTCVRISAGTWSALHLAQSLSEYWDADAIWLPEFVHCDLKMDLARREIDIGLRNARPDQPWLAGRRVGHVDFAIYGLSPDVTGWIGPTHDAAETPSGRWILAHHSREIVTKSNTPRLSAEMAKAGIGRIVLPTFIGAQMAPLRALSEPIAELRSEEWLVSHHEARHDPPIRAALDAIAGFLGGAGRRVAAE